jgi:hypothetical protein
MRLLALGLLVPLAGCPLLDVEVEVGEARLTYHDVTVDPAGPLSTSFVFDDLDGIHELTDRDTELELVRVEFHPKTPVDFTTLESARVTLSAEGLPDLAAFDCDGDCISRGGVLSIPAAIQHDIVDYLRGDSVTVAIDLAGTLDAGFTMDVDIIVRGRVHEQLEP